MLAFFPLFVFNGYLREVFIGFSLDSRASNATRQVLPFEHHFYGGAGIQNGKAADLFLKRSIYFQSIYVAQTLGLHFSVGNRPTRNKKRKVCY